MEEGECQTPFQGREVTLSLVESSVLVDRLLYLYFLKQQLHQAKSFFFPSIVNKNNKRSFLSSHQGQACHPAPLKELVGGKGGLESVLRCSF